MNKKFKLKKGDEVIVLAGKDKGKKGKIIKMLPKKNKAIVSEINKVKKNQKPDNNNPGGIIDKEMPMHISNLAFFDPSQKRSVWSNNASSFFSPIISRGMLMVVEENSSIKSFALKTLEESWINSDYLNRDLSNGVSYKDNIVVGDFEGYVHVINILNGRTVGREKLSRNPIKTILSRSDSLYVIDEAFNLISIDL